MAVPWKLTRDVYRLDHGELTGVLPCRGLSPGLRALALSWPGRSFRWPGPLLAVRSFQAAGTPPTAISFSAARPDHRLRSSLVDIQLSETSRCPLRLQMYWRAARSRQLDLEILATSANALDRLEVLTASEAPARSTSASELLVRSGASGGWIDVYESPLAGTLSLVVPRDRDAAVASLDGRSPSIDQITLLPPCPSPIACYRPTGRSWSYVEMSHPDDCTRVIAQRRGRLVEWGFGLFGLDIEKGVILRGRVRGIFLPRRGDLRGAERAFNQFVAEPPRLSV